MAAKSATKSIVLPNLTKKVTEAQERGLALARGGAIAPVTAPSGITPYAKPSVIGAEIGLRANPGGASAANALAKGEAQRAELAAGGAGRFMPEGSIRNEYMKRVNRPFQPPTSPGLVEAIFAKSEQARSTSTGNSMEASALVKVREEAQRGVGLERELKNAKAEAQDALKEVKAAVNSGNGAQARRAIYRARNARVRAQRTGLALVKAAAGGGRAALAAGAVASLQEKNSPKAIEGLRRFHASATHLPLPKSLTQAPPPAIDSEPIHESPGRGNSGWAYGSRGLGGLGSVDFVAAVQEEIDAIDLIETEAEVTAKEAQIQLVRLFDEAMTPVAGFGFFGAVQNSSSTATAQQQVDSATGLLTSFTALLNKGRETVGAITGKPAPPTTNTASNGPLPDLPPGYSTPAGPWIPKKFLIAGGIGAALLIGATIIIVKS